MKAKARRTIHKQKTNFGKPQVRPAGKSGQELQTLANNFL